MKIHEFLSYLNSIDVKIKIDGERLQCKAPKGILTPQLQAQIAEHKVEILAFLHQDTSAPIKRMSTQGEEIPLSFAQERLWFLDQLEGKTATYNMSGAIRLSGALHLEAFRQAIASIINRHQSLRTSFTNVAGNLRQVIHPNATVNLEVIDSQHLAATKRELALSEQMLRAAIAPFDLKIAPLIRCHLWKLSVTEYVCLINMHHIVSDGWSIGILIQELAALYPAFVAGLPSPLPELPIQYADFAVWQRQFLSGVVLETQLNYWQEQLQGAPELLHLPTDRIRPSIQTYHGITQSFTLNNNLTQQLQALSRKSGTTLFMTLSAAFSTLLYRYSGQSDILIGSPIANRNRREIESLIGFFVNTLVLRTRFDANPSFEQLLAQVRETTLHAYEHQDLPFERVVEAVNPQRSLSHSPLFQVMFALQNMPMGKLELPGITLSALSLDSTVAKFDLTLSMSETPAGLVGEWEYNTDLFDSSTIERMASHFENLLSAIVANPHQLVSELPLLSAAERQQLVVDWNDTAIDYPKDKCIHQLFEEQVKKTPDAIAVVFKNEQLTYQQLNHRANQLAHYLQGLGVKPETLVGICIERSLEMVVGLLGILKAGGAYVPLDPTYPQERLSYMLDDSAVEVLLTQQSLLESLPSHSARLVCLDSAWDVIALESHENFDAGVTSSNLTYVIYTSGSTGTPKGVQISHSSLTNTYLAWEDSYDLKDKTTSHLQMASFSFDVFSGDLVRALCSGGKLIICSKDLLLDPEKLSRVMKDEKVDYAEFVPAVLNNLISYLKETGQSLDFMQLIAVGSDTWYMKEYKEYQDFIGQQTRLINSYGVTEATIDSCYFENIDTELFVERLVPIGKPLANTQIYILDQQLQPSPIGVPGELHIGGDGLARGYLNRPELTAEKFISNPFSNDASARLYKTGDLARYLPDGNIEFLGRIDNQVKIRGFRIELGEIEAVLSNHPQVQQAIVIASEELSGNKRLVAYVVTVDESLSTSQLREYLLQKLPTYMVPAAFVTLDALPLTPNGKVDRKSLPLPDELNRKVTFIPPRNSIELRLTILWSDILNINFIGVTDDFFELGGHSILAVNLMFKIQQKFQKNLPLATLFLNPTIEQLARLLHSEVDLLPQTALVPIRLNGNQSPIFLTHPSGGNILCYEHLASYLNLEHPVYGLQSFGLDYRNEAHTSIEAMATHYVNEIRTVQPHGPYFLAGWSMGGLIVFEMAQQLYQKGEHVALLALIDSEPVSLALKEPKDDATLLVDFFKGELDLSLEELRQLETEKQLMYVLELAQEKNLILEDFNLAQASNLLKICRLNIQAADKYKPQHYSGLLTLFRASETDIEIESAWSELADNIETYIVPGNHQNIVKPPSVQILAQQFQMLLGRVEGN